MNEPFSARLKASTATIHDEVEHTTFMVDLMEGRLDSRAYALLLKQYEVIYAVLESKSREFADDPVFAPFHDTGSLPLRAHRSRPLRPRRCGPACDAQR